MTTLLRCLAFLLICLPLWTGCNDEFVPDDGLDYSGVSKHYVHPLYTQSKQLAKVSTTGQADFVYITDTHLADNGLDSPALLRFLVSNGRADRVIWGGDAISAYGEVGREWHEHQQRFLKAVRPHGSYYMVRGNHEFTSRQSSSNDGITYTAMQTSRLLREEAEPDVVRPADDPEACYYYVDDTRRRLRFCVFDTTDSIVSPTTPWGTVEHTSRRQLDWMEAHALHRVPEGYSLIIVTHIGLLPETYHSASPFEPLRQLLTHAGAPILMVLSGHMHQDFQTYDAQGVLHVLTGSDACYPEYSLSPLESDVKRRLYSTTSQLIDCFCLSPDRSLIDAVRIGAGHSRTFHRQPVTLSLADPTPVMLTLSRLDPKKVVRWGSYDALGYTCANDVWHPSDHLLTVSPSGLIHLQQTGSAVVYAVDRKGDKEFFHINIVP